MKIAFSRRIGMQPSRLAARLAADNKATDSAWQFSRQPHAHFTLHEGLHVDVSSRPPDVSSLVGSVEASSCRLFGTFKGLMHFNAGTRLAKQ